MRELSVNELEMVSGGNQHQCTPGNSIGGVSNFGGLGQDLIYFYEGLVSATSYVIERVARAL